MFLVLLIFISKYCSKHILLSSNSLWRDHNTSKKISVDWHGSTTICASQHWFIGKNTHKNKISVWLLETATRLSPSLPTSLPAFSGQTQHPASYPQPSRAPAACTQGWDRFRPATRKQQIRDPDRVGKKWIYVYLITQNSKFYGTNSGVCGIRGKKLFHTVDDPEDSVISFLKWQSPQIFLKQFQDFVRLRASLHSFMLSQELTEHLWDWDSGLLCPFWNQSCDSKKCGIKTTENWHTQTSI